MNNLYTYVNHNELTINDLVQVIPENWKNVQGLNLFPDEKLQDLEWAGHLGFGWVRLSTFDLSQYTALPEWFDLSKNGIKTLVKKERSKAETETLTWNGNLIDLDDKTKLSLSFKLFVAQSNLNYKCLWKFNSSEVEMTTSDLIDLSSFINEYIQKCFDLEFEKNKEIDACKTAYDLGQLDLKINWPSKNN
jgi:hypothetical protein